MSTIKGLHMTRLEMHCKLLKDSTSGECLNVQDKGEKGSNLCLYWKRTHCETPEEAATYHKTFKTHLRAYQ